MSQNGKIAKIYFEAKTGNLGNFGQKRTDFNGIYSFRHLWFANSIAQSGIAGGGGRGRGLPRCHPGPGAGIQVF